MLPPTVATLLTGWPEPWQPSFHCTTPPTEPSTSTASVDSTSRLRMRLSPSASRVMFITKESTTALTAPSRPSQADPGCERIVSSETSKPVLRRPGGSPLTSAASVPSVVAPTMARRASPATETDQPCTPLARPRDRIAKCTVVEPGAPTADSSPISAGFIAVPPSSLSGTITPSATICRPLASAVSSSQRPLKQPPQEIASEPRSGETVWPDQVTLLSTG